VLCAVCCMLCAVCCALCYSPPPNLYPLIFTPCLWHSGILCIRSYSKTINRAFNAHLHALPRAHHLHPASQPRAHHLHPHHASYGEAHDCRGVLPEYYSGHAGSRTGAAHSLCTMSYVLCPMYCVLCTMYYVLCPMSHVTSVGFISPPAYHSHLP
jgi:hypothetical protein